MTGALGEEYKGVLRTIFIFTKFYYLDIISKSKLSEKVQSGSQYFLFTDKKLSNNRGFFLTDQISLCRHEKKTRMA